MPEADVQIAAGIALCVGIVVGVIWASLGRRRKKLKPSDIPDEIVEAAMRAGLEVGMHVAMAITLDDVHMADAANDDYKRGWDDAVSAYKDELRTIPQNARFKRMG